MSKLDKDSVIEKFTQTYQAAHGKAPSIEAKGGWYSVDGGKNIRLAQLDEMADEIGVAPTKAAKVENVASAVADKSAKAKPVTKKPVAKKAASSFSVKDFYTQQILEVNPGNKPPR